MISTCKTPEPMQPHHRSPVLLARVKLVAEVHKRRYTRSLKELSHLQSSACDGLQ